ncbi:MAG TPA: substrate-binding domain-containing protein [Terriglobia bacterium]|nr:substrate-binding domain-containing protein [Terriglobia bacterium]
MALEKPGNDGKGRMDSRFRGNDSGRPAVVAAAVTLSVVAMLASCGKAPHEGESYYLVANNKNLPYWQEANAGFQDAVRQLGFGVKAQLVGPDSFSPSDELAAFNQAVAANASGILVSGSGANLFKDAIDQAVKKGIPVICIDSDVPDSARLMFIGTDNYRAGVQSGTRLAEALKGEGSVVVISVLGQLNLDERLRGAKDAFARYPKIRIEQTLDDQGDPRKANDLVSALIAKKAKMDGILCLEASGGPGAAEALHRLNFDGKITIVAMDKDQETLDYIASGTIVASMAQKPYTMAFNGLRFLDDLHHNVVHEFNNWRTAPASPLPTLVDTGIGVVTKENVQAYEDAAKGYTKPAGGL